VSAVAVIRAELRDAADVVDALEKWLKVCEPVERTKFVGFVVGFAEALSKNEKEEMENDDSSRS